MNIYAAFQLQSHTRSVPPACTRGPSKAGPLRACPRQGVIWELHAHARAGSAPEEEGGEGAARARGHAGGGGDGAEAPTRGRACGGTRGARAARGTCVTGFLQAHRKCI